MQIFDIKDKNLVSDCERIGNYYLNKYNGDYDKAAEEIIRLGIINIISLSKLCIIYTSRPGLLIGKRGENIEGLQKALGKDISIYEVNHINDLIIIDKPDSWDDFYAENIWVDNEFSPETEDYEGGI